MHNKGVELRYGQMKTVNEKEQECLICKKNPAYIEPLLSQQKISFMTFKVFSSFLAHKRC